MSVAGEEGAELLVDDLEEIMTTSGMRPSGVGLAFPPDLLSVGRSFFAALALGATSWR